MCALFIPLDGRLTSQNPLPSSYRLVGGEAMYMVAPGSATLGNSYQVTTAVLGNFFYSWPSLNTNTITAGATSVSPYLVEATDTRILFRKTISSPSYAVFPLAVTMSYPGGVLIKDLKGDAATNNITITFSNGEECDGLSTVVVDINYGWFTLNPIVGGGGWYLTS